MKPAKTIWSRISQSFSLVGDHFKSVALLPVLMMIALGLISLFLNLSAEASGFAVMITLYTLDVVVQFVFGAFITAFLIAALAATAKKKTLLSSLAKEARQKCLKVLLVDILAALYIIAYPIAAAFIIFVIHILLGMVLDGVTATGVSVAVAIALGSVAVALSIRRAVLLLFTQFAVVIDKKSAVEALALSAKKVEGKWWATFGRVLVPSLVIGIPTTIAVASLSYFLPELVAIPVVAAIASFAAIVFKVYVYLLYQLKEAKR